MASQMCLETSDDGDVEGSEDETAATATEQQSLPVLLDDPEVDDALAPAMQAILESKPVKGEPSPQDQVDASWPSDHSRLTALSLIHI